ncbi:8061_t:CDS:2 [Entrophospora sp. SA101]|nr:8061_t:CDS:2 [Entrophospora sp. SA101]
MLHEHQRALQRAQREMDRERSACKIIAKDLVRTRRYTQKFQGMKAQLQANLRSSQQMAKAMRDATKEMKFMNNQMNLSAMQKIMMEFEKESEMMDMKEEIMNDEDEEEETEMIVNQVLDEIGITLDQSERVPQAAEMESSDDAALQARLGNLRKE